MECGLVNKQELEVARLRDEATQKDIKFVSAPAYLRSVSPWSLAADIGLQVGDKVISINGQKFRDQMDFDFLFAQNDEIELVVVRNNEEIVFEIEKDPDDYLGLEFTTPLFNGVKECANDCPFCFIDNQPREQTRESLHLKDDDFRLSYLHGSYVTLTNLSFSDRKRIEELRPGPLYVSVHATDIEVRNQLLGRKKSIPILQELEWLASLDIPVHTQIVLCPGLNDGEVLRQTIDDLFSLKNSPVVSVAVVPVGLTKYHTRGLRRFSFDEALEVINLVESWEKQEKNRRKNFVFLSDEFFLMTHTPVPDQKYYGEYPQLEDGVGMTRLFLDEVELLIASLPHANESTQAKAVTWLNGTIARPVVDHVARLINKKLSGIELKPVCLDSIFWGTTNVAGLLTGNDILEGLKYFPKESLGQKIIIPSVMLKSNQDVFLDDLSLSELESKLGVPCVKAWGAKELIDVLC